ncbi:hypothetical protein Tco_1106751 [Tanacetum coccineum]
MSANDDFSLHDDEELSLHDDASLAGSVPASNKGDAPAKPPQIITTNTLSNIKTACPSTADYDTWADGEMEHYLEYIDNEALESISEWKLEEGCHKGKEGVYWDVYHGMDDAKEIGQLIEDRFGGNANSRRKCKKAVLKQTRFLKALPISLKESLGKGYDRFQKLLSRWDALVLVCQMKMQSQVLEYLPPAWDSLAMQ